MIQECKYYVECDNDCGAKPTPFNRKKDILSSTYIVYRYKSINAMADKLFKEKRGFVQNELCFCCEQCATDYFGYYNDSVGHYTRINHKRVN